MKKNVTYHSALQCVEELDAEELDRYENGPLLAIQNDITNGLPEEFDRCDVLWGEPPWAHGFKVFNARVGKEDTEGHAAFMRKCNDVIAADDRPAFVVTGKAYARYYSDADYQTPVMLPVCDEASVLYSYRFKPSFAGKSQVVTTEEVLQVLARKFDCLGDWCCGYGFAGRVFLSSGKSAVLADYNAKCIGAIKQLSPSW